MSKRLIYLDANATTSIDERVWEKMREVAESAYGNPGSSHPIGRKARQTLENSRELICQILGARPAELIFTSGGTESINLALNGIAAAVNKPEKTIALTQAEHPATMESTKRLQQTGWQVLEIPLDENGQIDSERLHDLPWQQIDLVSLIYAQNETGVIQDLTEVRKLCEEHNVYWHVDFVQAVGRIPVCFDDSHASAASIAVHKCHGPRGIGALLLQENIPIVPQAVGGFQEQGRRAGTEAVVLAAGMAEALHLWQEEQQERTEQITRLRDRLEKSLELTCSPVQINGVKSPRLPTTSHISFLGLNAEALLVSLGLAGICCSTGSACASGSAQPSAALLAMGIDPTDALSSLRFSLHKDLTEDDIDHAAKIITEKVQHLRSSMQ